MPRDVVVRLDSLVLSLSDALDIVHPYAYDHQQRVAYIAVRLGRVMGHSPADLADLMHAAALHDIGILSVEEKAESMSFEFEEWPRHIRHGVELLGRLAAFRNSVELVRFHHQPWGDAAGWREAGETARLSANAIHLADTVDRMSRKPAAILRQAPTICDAVAGMSGTEFAPCLVDRFRALAVQESFWLDFASPRIGSLLPGLATWSEQFLPTERIEEVAKVFSRIVDFRSSFTATHSIGVAVAAEEIARRMSFGTRELPLMRIAGHLHDLGKMCVPNAILEKPAKLEPREFEVIRGHSYYTWRILSGVDGLGEIGKWSAYHHERMDGTGYPFHIAGENLPLGSRIMCVADVITALTERRPYREGEKRAKTMPYMWEQVRSGALDGDVVGVLDASYGEIDEARSAAQSAYAEEYAERYGPGATRP